MNADGARMVHVDWGRAGAALVGATLIRVHLRSSAAEYACLPCGRAGCGPGWGGLPAGWGGQIARSRVARSNAMYREGGAVRGVRVLAWRRVGQGGASLAPNRGRPVPTPCTVRMTDRGQGQNRLGANLRDPSPYLWSASQPKPSRGG